MLIMLIFTVKSIYFSHLECKHYKLQKLPKELHNNTMQSEEKQPWWEEVSMGNIYSRALTGIKRISE